MVVMTESVKLGISELSVPQGIQPSLTWPRLVNSWTSSRRAIFISGGAASQYRRCSTMGMPGRRPELARSSAAVGRRPAVQPAAVRPGA